MKTVKLDVVPDESGDLWLWATTESDVPGEGGRERRGRIDAATCLEQRLRVMKELEASRAEVAAKEAELKFWKEKEVEAEALEEAQRKARKAKAG